MRRTPLEKDLDKAFEAYGTQVENIIAKVRETQLLPFCNKHSLAFCAVNGDWWFETKTGERLDEAFECPDRYRHIELGYISADVRTKRYRCKRLLKALKTDVAGYRSNDLGSLMENYKPEE